MSCHHCDKLRDEQQAFLAEYGRTGFGTGSWIGGMFYVDLIDGDGNPVCDGQLSFTKVKSSWPSWSRFALSELADCRCDCHTVARIGGLLPRLDG